MLINILIVVAVIIVVVGVIVALQPKDYRVARSTMISAPAASGICAGERFPQMGSMEPVGEDRSGDEARL